VHRSLSYWCHAETRRRHRLGGSNEVHRLQILRDACPFQIRTYYSDRKDYFPGQGLRNMNRLRRRMAAPSRTTPSSSAISCAERVDTGHGEGSDTRRGQRRDSCVCQYMPCQGKVFWRSGRPCQRGLKTGARKRRCAASSGFGNDPSVYYIPTPAMRKARLLSRALFPASAEYSLPTVPHDCQTSTCLGQVGQFKRPQMTSNVLVIWK